MFLLTNKEGMEVFLLLSGGIVRKVTVYCLQSLQDIDKRRDRKLNCLTSISGNLICIALGF